MTNDAALAPLRPMLLGKHSVARVISIAILTACAAATPAFAVPWMIAEAASSGFPLSIGGSGASELSGIAWLGANSYAAVSDDSASYFPLSISVDPNDGHVTSASAAPGILLAGSDLEDLALVAPGQIAVSDETGPQIRVHSLVDGSLLQTLVMPTVLSNIRPNLSLEALAWDATGAYLWSANEEALSVDGPVSGFATGSIVRLTRFDSSFNAAGQWAYVTDPIPSDRLPIGRDIELSGVSALCILSDGTILVLERALGDSLALRHRIYQIDLTAASDVSGVPSLDGAMFTPASKTLLWERSIFVTNFEGMALGPTLTNGSQSLLLVSDDGGGLLASIFPLTVRPLECGDGAVGGPEQCDDGNTDSGDGCDSACVAEVCADGIVNAAGEETCDDGNLVDGDGCDASCFLETEAIACQRAMAKAGAGYFAARFGAEASCRDRLNRGSELTQADGVTPVVDPTDCLIESETREDIVRAAVKAHSAIAKKCTDSLVTALDACGNDIVSLADGIGGGCLPTHADAQAATLADAGYGNVIPPEQTARRRCQETIGKASAKFSTAVLKALQNCRNGLHARKDLFYDSAKTLPLIDRKDCSDEYRTSVKLQRAGLKLRTAVADMCSDSLLADIGGACAMTIDGLVDASGSSGCLVSTGRAAADAMVEALYGP